MKISELEEFILEMNSILKAKRQFVSKTHSPANKFNLVESELYIKETLTETETKVYITISHYFRLVTVTIPDIAIAYEIWLKGILQILLDEVGLTFESWDRICSIGDHTKGLQKRVDKEWTAFLEKVPKGNINPDIWRLIQVGRKRFDELTKKKFAFTRKKFSN